MQKVKDTIFCDTDSILLIQRNQSEHDIYKDGMKNYKEL
jgi:hypothetical protein